MAFRESMDVGDLQVQRTLTVKKLMLGGDPFNESRANTGAKPVIDGVTFVIGAEAANVINVAIQLEAGEEDIDHSAVVVAYLSDDSAGIGISAAAPATSVAVGTDGSIIVEHTAKLAWTLDSEADGDIDLDITETGAATWYLVVIANGIKYVSGAITFAA